METRLFHSIVTVGLSLTAAACGGSTVIPAGSADASSTDATAAHDAAPEASTDAAPGEAGPGDAPSEAAKGDASVCACGTCCQGEAGIPTLCECEGGACFPCYV